MSEDAISAADLGDAGSRGERRRALRAERERQAQREQPQEPPVVRPFAVTLQGQEAAVLVADASDASAGEAPSSGSAAEGARSMSPSAPVDGAAAHPQDADAPSLFTPAADAPSVVAPDPDQPAPLTAERELPSRPGADEDVPLPPARRPGVGALPFDLPPFALPSDPHPSEWSAFTPVIPPEPLPFDERRPPARAPRETWTSPDPAPNDSWMALSSSPSPGPAEPPAAVSAGTPADESVWTVPTPEDGVPVEPSEPQERVDEPSPEPAAAGTNGLGGAGGGVAEAEDVPPPSPRPGWSADLSRVELFRSALEDLAQGPGDAGGDMPPQEPSADEFRTGELEGRELRADEPPAGGIEVESDAEELPPADEPPDEEPSTGEASTDELPATRLGVPGASDESPWNEQQRSELSWDEPPSAGESPPDSLVPDGEPVPTDGRFADEQHAQALADGEGEGEIASRPVSLAEPLAEPLAERPEPLPDDDEGSDGALPELGVPPVASASAPPPPPAVPSPPDDTHLPPLGRQAFGRAPTQRLAEALAHGEGPHPSEDDEPVRGTVAPVLRRSTERVRYPTSTMPVIRPPVMPPTPGSGIPIAPSRPSTVSWQQALSGDVVPAKKKKQPRRARVSKPRHESGGMGEYRPKVAADRSLTLLVVAMLLVLAGLVAAAVWTFWPSVSGGAGSLPPLGAPRGVGGP